MLGLVNYSNDKTASRIIPRAIEKEEADAPTIQSNKGRDGEEGRISRQFRHAIALKYALAENYL